MLSTATDINYWRFENRELAEIDLIDRLVLSVCDSCEISYPHFLLHLLLTELVSNAIDHGVLAMDSRVKRSAAGFERYIEERSRRLATPASGWISLTTEWTSANLLTLSIQDSGCGFDYHKTGANRSIDSERGCNESDTQSIDKLYGRGLQIINSLCDSVVHVGGGNTTVVEFNVSAVYL